MINLSAKQTGRIIPILSLLLFFWFAVNTATQKNPTTDEPVHVTRGITLWQTGDYRLQQEHTPFSHWLNGLLTMTEPLPDITSRDGWLESDRLHVARHLIWQSGVSVERLFFLARLPIIGLGMVVGAVLFTWAGALHGRKAQFLVACLFPFAPNLLAHTSLATTDFAATAIYLFVFYALWRYRQRPTQTGYIVLGLLIGFALTTKMTSLIIWPLLLIILYVTTPVKNWSPMLLWLGWFPIAGIVVWGLYLFTFGPVYIPQIDFTLSLPAPAYWHSLFGVSNHIEGGHRAYFLGVISDQGWFSYFTIALLIKTPVVFLLGTTCAIFQTIQNKAWWKTIYLWLPVLALYLAATFSRLNIGYRHILPIIPFLLLWTAIILATFWQNQQKPLVGRVLMISILLYVGFNSYIHPHHLSYFNPLAGGPTAGHRFLGDSNLDWGQDWQRVSHHIADQQLEPTHIAPFGFIDPSYYGLDGRRLVLDTGFANEDFSPANPAPGTYFISTNAYQGMLAQPDLFDWFRRQAVIDPWQTGFSIRKYEVNAKAKGDWIAHCTAPVPLLEQAEAEQIVNAAGVRHTYFDCTQSWVIPNQGTAGWYILPLDLEPEWGNTNLAPHLQEVYAHTATVFAPSYRVYYWDGNEAKVDQLIDKSAPQQVDESVQWLGYTAGTDTWYTIWQVTNSSDLPLSVFGHRYPQSDQPVIPDTADGLGYATTNWQPNDIFIQKHPFTSSQPLTNIDHFETGFYNYTNGERLAPPIQIDR